MLLFHNCFITLYFKIKTNSLQMDMKEYEIILEDLRGWRGEWGRGSLINQSSMLWSPPRPSPPPPPPMSLLVIVKGWTRKYFFQHK